MIQNFILEDLEIQILDLPELSFSIKAILPNFDDLSYSISYIDNQSFDFFKSNFHKIDNPFIKKIFIYQVLF